MSADETLTVGEALVRLLEAHGVEIVFGIPGVHTAELYRGLAASKIRHVTPRHEQGAGFMADGYARVSGRPGVCFVITGPGLTNTITAMAQAREDSVPMLVISGVNARSTLGRGLGCLHELPDQGGLMRSFAKMSVTLMQGADLATVLTECFAATMAGRPGPVHLEIPTDVMVEKIPLPEYVPASVEMPLADDARMDAAARLISTAKKPVILAGGGAAHAGEVLTAFAAKIDAPVILTANGRGLLCGHGLCVPASASLPPVRSLIAESDLVIAAGTELGMTDYDVYVDHAFPALNRLIRIDTSTDTIAAGPKTAIGIVEDCASALSRLLPRVAAFGDRDGKARAGFTRKATWDFLSDTNRHDVQLLHALRDAVPGCRMVGDSTRLVYAGNLFLEASRPKRWFNSATGFGSLGYLPSGAIGAALAEPGRPVIAIVGDGGLQFSLAELATAKDEGVNVVFLVWNNHGYGEIEDYMLDAGIVPEGVKPTPPDMALLAAAFGLSFARASTDGELVDAVARASAGGVHLVEFAAS